MPQETQSKTDLCGLLTGLVLLVTLVARVESHCDSALLISWFISFNGLIFNSSRPIHSWFVWDGVQMFAITCFFFCCLEDKKWELKREAAWTWTRDLGIFVILYGWMLQGWKLQLITMCESGDSFQCFFFLLLKTWQKLCAQSPAIWVATEPMWDSERRCHVFHQIQVCRLGTLKYRL